MTVGERIRAARKRAGLTQAEVSKRLGLSSNSTVAQWERGRRNPQSKNLYALANALECSVHNLLYDSESDCRDVVSQREIVESVRLAWKGQVYEKIRIHDFYSARDKLAVLQGIEFLAEALDLMGSNMSGRFALSELIDDTEAAYILSQEGE